MPQERRLFLPCLEEGITKQQLMANVFRSLDSPQELTIQHNERFVLKTANESVFSYSSQGNGSSNLIICADKTSGTAGQLGARVL